MPCLNEAETLEVCVEKAAKCLSENQIAGEVLIADNGSTDGSQEIARRLGARVVDVPTKGSSEVMFGDSNSSSNDEKIILIIPNPVAITIPKINAVLISDFILSS